MSAQLFDNIFILSVVSTLVPLVVFFLRWNRQSIHYRIIVALLAFSFISDLTIRFWSINDVPSSVLTNLYTVVEFILISVFCYKILFQNKARLFLYFGSVTFLVSLVVLGVVKGFLFPNNYLWSISSFILGTYSILYFCFIPFMIIERYFDKHLFSNIILTSSLCLYCFASVILFIFMDFVFANLTADQAKGFWSIYNIINVLKNVGITLAFFLSGKRNVYMTFSQLEKLGRDQDKQRELTNR